MPPDILTTLPIKEPIWTARTVCVDRRKLTRSAFVRSIVSAASEFSAVVSTAPRASRRPTAISSPLPRSPAVGSQRRSS
jgi:hypothetical protein